MDIFVAIISLLGGLAMFLYGIEVMGDGLKNSSGTTLKRILEKVTGNVFIGVLTGTLVTAVIQSSTATIVLTVALIGAGVLNLKQAVSIVMGANIGTTVTAQIVRLMDIESGDNFLLLLCKPDTLAPIALVIGIVLIMFVKKENVKTVADIFIGFGILFIGLMNMSSSVEPLAETEAFRNALSTLNNPILGILIGLVITVIIQSSSATVSMLQAVAVSGASILTFEMVYPVIMGINLGTCVTTAMVCSVGSGKDAKRTGVVHIVFNTIGTIVFMIGMSIMNHYEVFGADFWSAPINSGGIADFQTIFNLGTAALLLPFTSVLVAISKSVVKDDKNPKHLYPQLHTLDEKLYISPAVAVAEVTKAVANMGTIAHQNFERGCQMLIHFNEKNLSIINETEEALDQFADSADHFMIGLSKQVETEQEDRQVDMLMQSVPNFERIGDYATNLVELGERLQKEKAEFSEGAKQELKILFDAVNEILDITVAAFNSDDNEMAKAIEPLEEVIDDMVMILRDRHTKRLKAGKCSVDNGLVFMEALTYLERTSDQCSSIAVMMLARNNESILQNHYDYLKAIHAGNDALYNEELNRRRMQYIEPLKKV